MAQLRNCIVANNIEGKNLDITENCTVGSKLYVHGVDFDDIIGAASDSPVSLRELDLRSRRVGEVALFLETKSPSPEFPFFNIMSPTQDISTENWPDKDDDNDKFEKGLIQYLREKKLTINSSSIFFFTHYKRNEETVTLKLARDSVNATLLEGLAQDYRVHCDDSESDWKKVTLPGDALWRSLEIPADLIDSNTNNDFAITGFDCYDWTIEIGMDLVSVDTDWQAIPDDDTKYDYKFSVYPHRISGDTTDTTVTTKARHFSIKGAALFSSGGQSVEGMRMISPIGSNDGVGVYGLGIQVYIFGGKYEYDPVTYDVDGNEIKHKQPFLNPIDEDTGKEIKLDGNVDMDGD